jgi:hypothetical protein
MSDHQVRFECIWIIEAEMIQSRSDKCHDEIGSQSSLKSKRTAGISRQYNIVIKLRNRNTEEK